MAAKGAGQMSRMVRLIQMIRMTGGNMAAGRMTSRGPHGEQCI